MLDVHPPHEATHTWKDFFIHIATIVVGLIIAVGLEQTVEFFHHRHQIHIARERIREEARINRHILLEDEHGIEQIEAHMDRALTLVRNHKAATMEAPDFTFGLQGFYDEAYNSARESGVLSLMPYEESAMYQDAYLADGIALKFGIDLETQLHSAKAAMHGRQLNQLDSEEILPLIAAISEARSKAELEQKNLEIQDEEWVAILKGHGRLSIK